MKTSQKLDLQNISDQKKIKNKTSDATDHEKINEFVKTVVTGKTTDESENEGWQRTNFRQPEPEKEEKQGKQKKLQDVINKVYVQKNTNQT